MTTKEQKGKLAMACLFILLLFPFVSANSMVETELTPLPIFLLFLVIGVAMIIVGFFSNNTWLGLIGTGITFVMGHILQTGNLGIGSITNTTINGSLITSVTSYTAVVGSNSHLIGLFIMVFSVIMFFLMIFDGGLAEE